MLNKFRNELKREDLFTDLDSPEMDKVSTISDYSYNDYLEEELRELEEKELKKKGLIIDLFGY